LIDLINTIFNPVLMWLDNIRMMITNLAVPTSRGLNIGIYLSPFAFLGIGWITFISTGIALGLTYLIVFIIQAQQGLFIKFKDTIKWW